MNSPDTVYDAIVDIGWSREYREPALSLDDIVLALSIDTGIEQEVVRAELAARFEQREAQVKRMQLLLSGLGC